MTRVNRERAYVCHAPGDLCQPCRSGDHSDCSWDGEPDCLCKECPETRKAANRAALEREMKR